MRPRGLFFKKSGIKDKTAKVIQGSDKIPFFFSGRKPEMVRRVMLDKFTNVVS